VAAAEAEAEAVMVVVAAVAAADGAAGVEATVAGEATVAAV